MTLPDTEEPARLPLPIMRARHLDLRFAPWVWPFAIAQRAAIDAHFATLRAATPRLWNGRVLLLRDPQHDGETFRAQFFETDYASFLAWRDWGFPDTTVFNGFGMGALQGSDGVFLLGEMGSHTANAGQIYFPSGTPDLNDLKDGAVDMAASVAREVEEETGLAPSDYRAADHWHCVRVCQWIAFMRLLRIDALAADARARIARAFATQIGPELSAIHLVRDRRDFTTTMPEFVRAYIDVMTERT